MNQASSVRSGTWSQLKAMSYACRLLC
jgi:hypothetical protein